MVCEVNWPIEVLGITGAVVFNNRGMFSLNSMGSLSIGSSRVSVGSITTVF